MHVRNIKILAGLLFAAGAILGGSAAANANHFSVLLDGAVAFDEVAGTITLPLHHGISGDQDVWFVITDSSDRDNAQARGVNWAPKLANALGTGAVQTVSIVDSVAVFPGTVDFSPEHAVVPGPNLFPPDVAQPGSVGDPAYTPLITIDGNIVLNAPQVANATGVHDKVAAIDFVAETVTLRLTAGFYHGKAILYLSTDSSNPVGAALEESSLAPNLDEAPGIASNDPETSARSGIVVFVNGQTGVGNPDRQGLLSALLGEGSPLNVTQTHPRDRHEIPEYSPLWDIHPAVWTDEAIASGQRRRLDHHEDIAQAVEDGLIVSGGFGPRNHDFGGLSAAGFIVNCPVMAME